MPRLHPYRAFRHIDMILLKLRSSNDNKTNGKNRLTSRLPARMIASGSPGNAFRRDGLPKERQRDRMHADSDEV